MSGTDYTTTPTLGLYKPNYDMDAEQWGNHLNQNADIIDTAMSPGGSPVFVPIAGGAMTGRLSLSGDPTGPLDAVTKQYLDSHTGTGSQIYLGGWNPVTNVPTLASGALANGVLQPTGNYYLCTVGGTSTAIDGLTTWLAGDYITSNGTVWQRVQASSSPYLPLAGGTVTGTTSINAPFNVGSDTQNQNLAINGAKAQARALLWRTASLNRWRLAADVTDEPGAGSNIGSVLSLYGYNDDGSLRSGQALLTFDRRWGSQYFRPYATTFSGSDAGTPGQSMSYAMNASYSGASTSPNGITFNRWWVTSDTVTDQNQGIYYLFEGDFGPALTGGGRTNLQSVIKSAGNISINTAGGGGGATLLAGRFYALASTDGGGSTTVNGASCQALDLNAQLTNTSSNWGILTAAQVNMSTAGGNNLYKRHILFLATGSDPGSQAGLCDAVIASSLTTAAGPAPAGGYPAPGMGYRSFISIGQGGNTAFVLDYFNGEILNALPPIQRLSGSLVSPPQACLRGINVSNIQFSDSAWWSPGVKIRGDGTTRINRLQVSTGTNGPVIDAPLQVATITSIASSQGLFAVGEQVYDHLGGTAVVDTVDGANNNQVTAAHYLYPPRVASGEVMTVATATIAVAATSGATTLRLRNGSVGFAINDAVATANGVAGIASGTVVTAHVESQTNCTITFSLPITANIPAGTMLIFTQTMPSTTATFRTGSLNYFTANISWAAATEIAIGSASVGVRIPGSLITPTRQFAQGSETIGTTVGNSDISINGAATGTRAVNFQSASVQRWQIAGTNSGVVATNADTDLTIGSYLDTGAFNNFFLKVKRASGPLGLGPPVAYDAGPIYLTHTAATTAGGAVGHRILINDVQPVYPLAANPISTVSGSPTVTVALTNAASIVSASPNPASWVNLTGVTAVGGITPTGWLRVQSISTNSFTVTWTSNATSTTSGGGSSVTIQPSFPNGMVQNQFTQKSGSQGFNVMHSNIYNADPAYQPLVNDKTAGNSGWTMYWNVAASPSDAAGTYQTSILVEELDILYRGTDDGYQPLLAAGVHSLGKLYGPLWTVPNYITGGGVAGAGTPNHINTMWTLFGNEGFPGTYICMSVQPNALVGKGIDTVSNHGGVAFDLFGSYTNLRTTNPFTTTAGTSTITVKTTPTAAGPGQLRKQVNGGTVYIPGSYTISGVTFGNATYTISNVDDVGGSFTITGSGTAAGNVSGGGAFVGLYFTNLSPYAGMQLSGLWEDGIYSHPTRSRFTSGLIVHTQPGVGMGWDDGTGIASISGTAGTAGNVGVTITTAGTGVVRFAVLPPNAANDAAAATANVPIGGVYRNGSVLQVRVA